MLVATVVDPGKDAHVDVLSRSIAEHLPGTRFRTFRPEEFEESDRHALKPLVARSLLGEDDSVVLLDPEVRLFGRLDDVAAAARAQGVILIASVLQPVPLDGLSPTEPDLQAQGLYNVGCLALGSGAGAFLDWYEAHLRTHPENDIARGSSLDGRWLDFVPAYFDHHLLRDAGLGVGSWNLHERRIREQNGGYIVNGRPLRLFNFRGFDPERPSLLTHHRFHSALPFRAGVDDQPALGRLRAAYAEALRQ